MVSTRDDIPRTRTDFLPSDSNHFATIARRRDFDCEGKFQEALKLANVYYESGASWHKPVLCTAIPKGNLCVRPPL
jgi:2-methylisocitrate lyase-like PEP mutase family enzyme